MDDEATHNRFIKGLPLMPPEAMKANIEAAIEGAAPDVLSDFKIAAHALNGEAWLRCSFRSASLSEVRLDPDEARLFGWLTWGNCD